MRKTQHCRHCGGPINLTDEERISVRARLAGGEKATDIARSLKVSSHTVYRIADQGEFVDPNQGVIFADDKAQG